MLIFFPARLFLYVAFRALRPVSFFPLSLLLLVLPTQAEAQTQGQAEAQTQGQLPGTAADSLTRQLAAQVPGALPGFAVAVVDAHGIRYEHGFGLADRATARPFTPATVHGIGSVSKTLLGICLLKGVELGYFTLDTPVNDLLPWPVRNPRRPAGVIRIRHLATHTAGLLDREGPYLASYRFGAAGSQMRFDSAAPPAQQQAAVLGTFLRAYLTRGGTYYARRNFAPTLPGAAYAYSNVGAALAAYLLERKSGLSYADFARRYVLTPSDMTASGWSYAEIAGQPQATGYRPNGQPYEPYLCLTYPDGGLHASVHDLALYLQQIIRGAAGQPGLLTAGGFGQLLAPQFAAGPAPTGRNPREPDSGIFWAIRPNGQKGHLGSDSGTFAALFFDPQTSIGLVFLTNVDFDDNPAATQAFTTIWQTVQRAANRLH